MALNGSTARVTPVRYGRNEAGIAQVVVANSFGVPVNELCAKGRRDAYTAFVRHVAMYLAHITFGLTLDEVAYAFGRDRSTASYACHRIEDLREDPGIDRQLTFLEDVLRETSRFGASL